MSFSLSKLDYDVSMFFTWCFFFSYYFFLFFFFLGSIVGTFCSKISSPFRASVTKLVNPTLKSGNGVYTYSRRQKSSNIRVNFKTYQSTRRIESTLPQAVGRYPTGMVFLEKGSTSKRVYTKGNGEGERANEPSRVHEGGQEYKVR